MGRGGKIGWVFLAVWEDLTLEELCVIAKYAWKMLETGDKTTFYPVRTGLTDPKLAVKGA